jgi:CBS domain-containing protein
MAEKLAEEIMNKKVITITEYKSILYLAKLLLKNNISGVPVVDKKGVLKGIVSETDIVDFTKKDEIFLPMVEFPIYNYAFVDPNIFVERFEKNKEALSKTKVKEIMHTWVRKAKKDVTEKEIAAIMIGNKVNRVPIVDDDNKVIGIITRSDIVKSVVGRDIR